MLSNGEAFGCLFTLSNSGQVHRNVETIAPKRCGAKTTGSPTGIGTRNLLAKLGDARRCRKPILSAIFRSARRGGYCMFCRARDHFSHPRQGWPSPRVIRTQPLVEYPHHFVNRPNRLNRRPAARRLGRHRVSNARKEDRNDPAGAMANRMRFSPIFSGNPQSRQLAREEHADPACLNPRS